MKKWMRRIAPTLMFATLGYTILGIQSQFAPFIFGLPSPSDEALAAVACLCILSCIFVIQAQPKTEIGPMGVIASTIIAFAAFFLALIFFIFWVIPSGDF